MTNFRYSRDLDKPTPIKSEVRSTVASDVDEWLRSGNKPTQLASRKTTRYRNPVPLSGFTLARSQMNSRRKARANVTAAAFPSTVDPAVAQALSRGRGYGRRRSSRLTQSSY